MTTFCSIFLQDDFILTHSAVQNFPTKGVSPISREKKKRKDAIILLSRPRMKTPGKLSGLTDVEDALHPKPGFP